MTRLVSILQAHPDGMRTADIAERVGMSVRTVYRDLRAIEEEIGVPVWGETAVAGASTRRRPSCRRSS